MRSLKAFTVSFQLWILLQCCTMKCITPSSLSLSTTHIQALDIQCTLWSPKYTPNDILDISKNYHILLRYLYLPYTLHWYFFLVMQSSRILEGFPRSSFKSSAFLFSLSLSNMALAWNCCQLTFQFF